MINKRNQILHMLAALVCMPVSVLLTTSSGGCHAQDKKEKFPKRCLVDHENLLVYRLPEVERNGWNDTKDVKHRIIVGNGSFLSGLSISIGIQPVSTAKEALAVIARDQRIYAPLGELYKWHYVENWQSDQLDVVSYEMTTDSRRMFVHQVFLDDKTVEILGGCREKDVPKYRRQLNEIKKSIRPYRKNGPHKNLNKGMTFRDELMGIEVDHLPSVNAVTGSTVLIFSKLNDMTLSTKIQASKDQAMRDLRKDFYSKNKSEILTRDEFSDKRIQWKSKGGVNRSDENSSKVALGRIDAAWLNDHVLACINTATISERDFSNRYRRKVPWTKLGSSEPLARFIRN